MGQWRKGVVLLAGTLAPGLLLAAEPAFREVAIQVCIPVEFILFGVTLLGVALLHHHTLAVALTGLAAVAAFKLVFTGFAEGPGLGGLIRHLAHEWVILTNLLGLLLGFAVLARHFEDSRIPQILPRFLPSGWPGGFALLAVIIGYLAAIVAAANAGGSGSVVGDTTTTMMWISGVG
ncbi:MAG: citrate transporter, partial [Gammaproteobacteria bacterium]|nr:citrate transporter [Gammaproteobacteria bacterium]